MKIRLLFLLSSLFLSCTSDDSLGDAEFMNIRGTVVGNATCNTENNGSAIEIELRDGNPVSTIITPNLPDEFKQEGQEIIFDMEQSQEGLTICAAIYYPEMFYKVYNVNGVE